MLATLYNVAVDLPIQESAWWLAFLWLCRMLYLFSYIRCYCCGEAGLECLNCEDSAAPEQFQVVIGSVGEQSCGTCAADYNGTYVLSHQADTIAGTCCWDVTFANKCIATGPTVNVNKIHLQINAIGDISVEFTNYNGNCTGTSGASFVTYIKSFFPSVPDCDDLTDEDIPFNFDGSGGCDFSASTCTVSSV